MKLEICGEENPNNPVVRLKFEKLEGGLISVVAVDYHGNMLTGGYLVSFLPDGKIKRHSFVCESLGFQLDKSRRIQIQKD